MRGKPKFKHGDTVQFTLCDKTFVGEVYIIDEHGTFNNPSDVSYDIMVKNYQIDGGEPNDVLFKHITESKVTKVRKSKKK